MREIISNQKLKRSAATLLILITLQGSGNVDADSLDEIFAGKPTLEGVALPGYPLERSQLSTVQNNQGSLGELVQFYLQWPARAKDGFFPWETVKLIDEFGSTPVITWEPLYYATPTSTSSQSVLYEEILSGLYDDYIIDFAKATARYNKPIMIRFAHEMNINGFHWGTTRQEFGPQSALIYKKMFRHVVSLFRAVGTTNVLWVFCPNNESVPVPNQSTNSNMWNVLSNYYPGDEYVDVLGLDGFNWGTSQKVSEGEGWNSSWRTFPELFSEPINELKALSPTKPILIFETGTVEEGGSHDDWLAQALTSAQQMGVKGIVWFLADKENNWRLPSQFIATNSY